MAGTASKWRWVFSGGGRPHPVTPTPGTSDLYFTGHEDGRVRVWDVTGHVPSLLTTVPFDSGGPGVRLRAVTSLQVLFLVTVALQLVRSNDHVPSSLTTVPHYFVCLSNAACL